MPRKPPTNRSAPARTASNRSAASAQNKRDKEAVSAEVKKAPAKVGTLTVDQVDAVLRDPNCPADVRATVAAQHTADQYLAGVKFNVSPDDGFTTVAPEDNEYNA